MQTVTVIGMIYKSTQYLDFMMYNIKRHCLGSEQYKVDYLVIGNQPTPAVEKKLKQDRINHLLYTDRKPDDYYLNRVYRAWNFGGLNAKGDIIVFMNSDEALSPQWLENLLKHLTPDTIPCSRLVESNKMLSGQHALKAEFGRHPREFDEVAWTQFYRAQSADKVLPGGLYMPCAFYKKDFLDAGGYPEGNIYDTGVGTYSPTARVLFSGDDWFFHQHPMLSKKKHITVCDSLVYHIIEGEKDE